MWVLIQEPKGGIFALPHPFLTENLLSGRRNDQNLRVWIGTLGADSGNSFHCWEGGS